MGQIYTITKCIGKKNKRRMNNFFWRNLQKQSNKDFLYSCLMLSCILPTTNFLTPRMKKKSLINPSFEIHSPNWTFAVIKPIFTVSLKIYY